MLSFLKSEKDQEIARIKKEIKNSEFKKTSIISALVEEKTQLDLEKNTCFEKMGAHAYSIHKGGSRSYDFAVLFAEVEEIEGKMAEKDKKIAEVSARYDDEITLLTATLPSTEPPSPLSPPPFCEKCGTQSSHGDAFCQNCGNKMG